MSVSMGAVIVIAMVLMVLWGPLLVVTEGIVDMIQNRSKALPAEIRTGTWYRIAKSEEGGFFAENVGSPAFMVWGATADEAYAEAERAIGAFKAFKGTSSP